MKSILTIILLLTVFTVSAYSQKAKKVDFAQKIKEATPQALPQEPVAKKVKTDAQDNNLKGKVKSVLVFNQENEKSPLNLDTEEYYDENGNWLKHIYYLDGYPMSVAVWGYIDDNRVSKTNFIEYESGEIGELTGIFGRFNESSNANTPRDERYSIKHVSKYDEQGRLVEKMFYENNGNLSSRIVHKYKENQREVLHYAADGSEMSQTIEILDKDGNKIERHLMDGDGKIGDKEINIFEFDAQGNWVVEKTFEEKKVKGKTVKTLLWISRRTITYFT